MVVLCWGPGLRSMPRLAAPRSLLPRCSNAFHLVRNGVVVVIEVTNLCSRSVFSLLFFISRLRIAAHVVPIYTGVLCSESKSLRCSRVRPCPTTTSTYKGSGLSMNSIVQYKWDLLVGSVEAGGTFHCKVEFFPYRVVPQLTDNPDIQSEQKQTKDAYPLSTAAL